jgi:hypothetical protein
MQIPSFTVILNLFQDPLRLTALSVRVEKWAPEQVRGDEQGREW